MHSVLYPQSLVYGQGKRPLHHVLVSYVRVCRSPPASCRAGYVEQVGTGGCQLNERAGGHAGMPFPDSLGCS
jgi:hypothetical protein